MSKRILITDEITDVQKQDFINLGSSPATPESGHGLLYAKNDGKIYFKNDAGTEKALGEADLSGYQVTSEKGAANGYASLDAGGLVPIAQLPPSVMERIAVVADQTARYALTTATVQDGDVVKQTDTGVMYFVKDDTNLGNSSGYELFAAGTAASVPWSGITSIDTQVADLAALSYSGNANKLVAVNAGATAFELITAPATGANQALSNLASVAINDSLIFGTGIVGALQTKAETGATNSELMNVQTGETVNGDSGSLTLQTGAVSGSGTRGAVVINGSALTVSAPVMTIPNSSGQAAPTQAVNDRMLRRVAGGWYKIQVNYSYFTAAATSETKTLIALYGLGSTNKLVDACFVLPTTAFAGTGITAATIEVGASTSGTTAISDPYSVFAVGNSNWQTSQSMVLSTSSVDTTITATLRTVGGNISALTSGVVDVYLKFSELTSLAADLVL